MDSASLPTIGLFLVTVALVAGLLLLGLLRSEATPSRALLVFTGIAGGWLALPGVLAATHRLDRYDPLPGPIMVVLALTTTGTVALALSPLGARLARSVPLAMLVGFQAFRVPVEIALHRLHVEGLIPVQMTYSGINFDIVTGLTAAALGLWLKKRGSAPRLVLAWNLMGLALLATIVVVALLSTPVAFRAFIDQPTHTLPSTFPFVWLPTFLVQAALFGHLLVFRAPRPGRG